jgi:hypothetical protein
VAYAPEAELVAGPGYHVVLLDHVYLELNAAPRSVAWRDNIP